MSKAVLRYRDGRVLKGRLTSFQQTHGFVRVIDQETGFAETVRLDDLKAVFFVKDFTGVPERHERKAFPPRPEYGRRTVVRFTDGEELWGYTQGYAQERAGFFFFPSDKASNNDRVFVLNAATEEVRFLGMGEAPAESETTHIGSRLLRRPLLRRFG